MVKKRWSGGTNRGPRPLWLRSVAGIAVVALLSTMLRPAVAGTRSGPPGSTSAATHDSQVINRLAPVIAEWQQGGARRSAAVLFDGDQATSLQTGSEAQLRVVLPAARQVVGIGVFGGANGSLSVATLGANGREAPLSGLQEIDLRALPLRWNRFWAGGAADAGELILRWRPTGPGEGLREIEIFGLEAALRPPAPTALADGILAGSLPEAMETWAEPGAMSVSAADIALEGEATFQLSLPIDPKLVGRAFLVYELAGLSHWAAPLRQVNGFSILGGHRVEPGTGGLQVEEISPEWLFRGDNEIRFHPSQDENAVGFEVRRLRLVTVPPSATPEVDGRGAVGDLARLSDGDPDTGIRGRQGRSSVTLPLAADAQPAALNLQVRERLSGRLHVTTARADRRAPTREFELSGMEPGWHSLPLDSLAPGSAVQLTWDFGREGSGFISEVRLVSSPAPVGAGRRLVVSYPLHGECVDHQVYVRGFVTPVMDPSRFGTPPQLWAGDVPVERGVAPDGAFAVIADEPVSVRGKPWSITLRARFSDGDELTRVALVDPCGDRPLAAPPVRRPGEPLPLVEDVDAPFAKVVTASKGDVLEMGGARVKIPAGALERDTRITMRPLVDSQVAALGEPLMENVTPGRTGFRLGPHNLKFKTPVHVTIPYDRSLVRRGLEPGELGVFTFDEEGGRWQRLPTVGMAGRDVLVAETTHFSDFIVATLPQPEHPQPVAHGPGTVADVKAGNPAEGMTLIKPPTANSSGSAHVSFPIEVVPGRHGMQPNLSLEYDSSAGNSIVGWGWNLPMSHIEPDTKFGVPRYDQLLETERYLLDGDELVPEVPRADRLTSAQTTFRRRVEGRFERIIRDGGFADGGWTVTDRDGMVREYGHVSANQMRVKDLGNADTEAVYWPLERVTDAVGNRIQYTYTKTTGGTSGSSDPAGWNELVPSTIMYTSWVNAVGNEGDPARFRVTFSYETRPDPTTSTRLGREIRTTKRLKTILSQYLDVNGSTWITFRKYTLGYKVGEFGKTLLSSIQVGNTTTSFYRHDFEYQQLHRVPYNGQQAVDWPSAQVWGYLPPGDTGALGKGTAGSIGISGFGGLGPTICYPHVGAGMSGGGGDDVTREAFTDINGDGLPDIVRGTGQVLLNRFAPSGPTPAVFTPPAQTVSPFDRVGEGKSSSRTYSIGVHLPGEFGGNAMETVSRAAQLRGLVDVNGDGLPDSFNGSSYECNNFPGSTCSGGSTTLPFGSPICWGGGSPPCPGGDTSSFPYIADPDPNADGRASFKTQMVARWTAPFSGTVTIEGPARRMFTISSAQQDPPPTDPATAAMFHRYRSTAADALPGGYKKDFIWFHEIAPTESGTCAPSTFPSGGPSTACTGYSSRLVKEGDELFFVVGAPEGNQRNVVEWGPKITYENIACTNPASPKTCVSARRTAYDKPIYSYNLQSDLRVAGGLPSPWVSGSADTKPNGDRPSATTVRITGQINKRTTTPDDVRFQIVRVRQGSGPVVVWPSNGQPHVMTAAQTGTFNFDQANVVIDVRGIWASKTTAEGTGWVVDGDQLVFQVITDSPIDPVSIDWDPIVTYQRYCYPDPVAQQSLYLHSNPRLMPSPQQVPIVCTDTPASVIGAAVSQPAEVQFPAFRYAPDRVALGNPSSTLANPDRAIYLFSDSANHTFDLQSTINITPGPRGVDVDSTNRGQVVALVQSTNRLLAKKVIPITSSAPLSVVFDAGPLTINGADPLYFTIVSFGMHNVSWNPEGFTDFGPWGTPSTVHKLAEPPLPGFAGPATHRGRLTVPMSGGFHQWTFGVWNADAGPLDPDLIDLRYSSPGDPTSPFFPPTPASRGLPGNPAGGDVTLIGANLPLWRGRASDDYIAQGYLHASYSGAGAVLASLPAASAFRRSRSDTKTGAGGIFATLEIGAGETASELDVLDVNGDGLPDLIGMDRVALNLLGSNNPSFGPQIASPLPFEGLLRRSTSKTSRWGIGLGSIASQLFDKPGADGSTKMITSTLPSFGLGYNIALTDLDLVDINGDGVLDQVQKDPQTGNIQVRLGLGLSWGRAFQSANQTWTMPAFPSAALDLVSQVASDVFPFTASTSDALRAQESASNSYQVNIMGIGGGVAHSTTRTVIDMVDVNGDGLLDRVMKRPLQPNEMLVQFNTGLGFLPAEVWTGAAWSADVPINSDTFTSAGLGTNDALGFSQTKSTAMSAGAIIPIPLFVVCLVVEVAAQSDDVENNTQMTFQDVNGDGYPDMVFKKNDLSTVSSGTGVTVHAKLNPIGTANLLTHVEGPIGGSFDIEYARAGNEVDSNRHVDMPTNRWVMSKVTVNNQPKNGATRDTWNQDMSIENKFTYADGFHSRADREFVGFAKVTTENTWDGSKIEDTYDTLDVYHKGLLAKRVVRDIAGKVFDVAETVYEARVLQNASPPQEPRAVQFIVDRYRRYRSYDGNGTNPDDPNTVTREEARDYDNTWGQLALFEDRGDVSTPADDVTYFLQYYADAAKYIRKPNFVVAYDPAAGSQPLAFRTATYYPNGQIETVTDLLRGGRNAVGTPYNGTMDVNDPSYQIVNPTWKYTYNGNGNLHSVQDPSGYTLMVEVWEPFYDVYPLIVSDSFGYTSTTTYNVALGAVAQAQDINGVWTQRGYDQHQRLNSISTRKTAADPWTERLHIDYQSTINTSTPASALVTHWNPEQSKSLAFTDGWGRIIQTKKNAVVDDGSGNATSGVIVSGRIKLDGRSRLTTQGLPIFRSGQTVTNPLSLSYDPIPDRNSTGFAYDVLSRPTQVNRPTGRGTILTAYDVVTVGTVRRKQKTVTDSNGETVESYSDARGRVISVDQHNTIGVFKTLTTKYDYDRLDRLKKVTDAKAKATDISWDTMGRMVTLTNLDTGTTRYDHDTAGNLARKENANGKIVRYVRTFNRLDQIDYPDSTDVFYTYGRPGAAFGRAGRVEVMTDETGGYLFDYDDFGNVAKTVWSPAPQPGLPAPAPYTTAYSWDPVMKVLRSVTMGDEVMTYGYETGGTVNAITGSKAGVTITFASKILHNEIGERTLVQLGNGAVTRYTYEPATRRLDTLNTDSGATPIQRLDYDYDFVGNVTQVVDSVPAPATTLAVGGPTVLPGPSTRTFTYDDLHQLKTSSGSYTGIGSHGGRTYSLTMTYNEIGNITRKNQVDKNKVAVGAPLQTVTYNAAYTYGSTRPHAATQIGPLTNTYDNDGNLTKSVDALGIGREMTWNEEDRLRTLIQEGTSTTFLYRPDGERAIKRGNSETFYVSPYFSERTGVSKTRHILLGNERIATVVTPAGGTMKFFYHHSDHLQSNSVMTDSSGKIVQHDLYLPFGETWTENVQNGDTSNRTPYLFNGKELDETRLYYFGGRYYDPQTARWQNPDPILASYVGGTPNGGLHSPANLSVYSYAYNSPVTVRDPSGLSPEAKIVKIEEVLITPTPIGDIQGPAGPKGATGESISAQDFPNESRASDFESELDTTPIKEPNVTLRLGVAARGVVGAEGSLVLNLSRHGIAFGYTLTGSVGSGFDVGSGGGIDWSNYYPSTGLRTPKLGSSADFVLGPAGFSIDEKGSVGGTSVGDLREVVKFKKAEFPGGIGSWLPVVTYTHFF